MEKSGPAERFLQAPVQCKSLEEIESKLTQLDHLFHAIGILGLTILSLQSELRSLLLAALDSLESMSAISEHIQQFLQNLYLQIDVLRTCNEGTVKNEPRIASVMV